MQIQQVLSVLYVGLLMLTGYIFFELNEKNVIVDINVNSTGNNELINQISSKLNNKNIFFEITDENNISVAIKHSNTTQNEVKTLKREQLNNKLSLHMKQRLEHEISILNNIINAKIQLTKNTNFENPKSVLVYINTKDKRSISNYTEKKIKRILKTSIDDLTIKNIKILYMHETAELDGPIINDPFEYIETTLEEEIDRLIKASLSHSNWLTSAQVVKSDDETVCHVLFIHYQTNAQEKQTMTQLAEHVIDGFNLKSDITFIEKQHS
jgi:hypothetical protein